ncbi:MAG: DUF1775 domain-containing protein [Burkholderiaceae bacterium]
MFTVRTGARLAIALAATFAAPQVLAHITLEIRQAPIETRYKAVLRVPHGCDGSPTTALRVQIPEGAIAAKPQPKAGWQLETTEGDYARPYTMYGAQLAAGVKEIAWTGDSLPDAHYDEFVFVAYLSDGLTPGETLYCPVVQECEQGVERWTGVPDASHHGHGHGSGHSHSHSHSHSESQAPGLKLLPKP